MFGNSQGADAALLKAVNQRLSRSGAGSQSRISATVNSGTVTLSGRLQYDAQRSPLLKLVARVAGVRRVIDQLQVPPRVNQYAQAEANAASAAKRAEAEVAETIRLEAEAGAESPTELADAADAPAT